MLTVQNLSFSYHHKKIIDHLDLTVHQGDCIGIIGANGCGKSTLLSLIAGAKKADAGTICFDNAAPCFEPQNHLKRIGYVPQENPLIPDLSVRDNLFLWFCGDKRAFRRELESGFLALLNLSDMLSMPVSKLSGGMKKRVSLGIALQNHPALLVLDEPSAALDLVCKADIRHYLSVYLASGGTMIITTHEEPELALCNQLFLLKQGLLHQIDPTLRGDALIELIKA